MKSNLKVKAVITAVELEEAKKLFFKVKKLKDQLAEAKKSFGTLEAEFFRKFDKKADVEEGSPMFVIKEWSRKVIAWEVELERLCGKEAVEEIKENTTPREYRSLEFGDIK